VRRPSTISTGEGCRVVAGFAVVAGDEVPELAADAAGAAVVGCVMEQFDTQG
jgi:hypothetical protein